MASPFQRYTGGIEASTGNLVQASGQMANQTLQTFANFGQNLAEGLKTYNDNSAKNDILTAEAEQLGQQIQQFAAQFGDSPEHKPFADSLQPYIQQLAKVPSMSLTQKMGAVTGVKAAFGNVGQQLQVFELMRKERMARDMNAARGNVREFDEQTVPTAIIPSGKLPYFYNKNYTEQEGELVRLANEAKARGASVDLPSVLDNWRKGLKANAMSRPDLPPQIKEALVKQIDAGEKVSDEDYWATDWDKTNYDEQGENVSRVMSSVKEQLAPPKVEAPVNKGTAPDKTTEQARSLITDTISKLEGMSKTKATLSDSEFNKLVAQNPASSRYTKVANLEAQGWKRSVDDKGKVSWSGEIENKQVSDALAIYKGELDKLNKPTKESERASREEADKKELVEVDSLLKSTQEKIDSGEALSKGWVRKMFEGTGEALLSAGDWAFQSSALALADSKSANFKFTPENADAYIREQLGTKTGKAESLLFGWASALVPNAMKATGRTLTVAEERNLKDALERYKLNRETKVQQFIDDPQGLIEALKAKKKTLESSLATGIKVPTAAEISKAQQAAKPAEAKAEPEYALTNQYNMALGTTTGQVATSLESKRNDMKTFFQKKYGYVPASFEESFKATYPEANFKTMETPYGAFMYDGKDWKQIQMQQVKPPSRKELAEEKAVSFGKLQSDSSIDVNEFGELVPNSGVYVRGIFGGTPTEAFKFRTQMLEASNAKKAVGRLVEINDMVGESMPWNSKVWGEAKALLPQIKAGLRTDIIGVGTVSNYEQELINDVVAEPTKFWSLESSDRAKLAVIMDKISNRLAQEPANYGLEVKIAGKRNEELERRYKVGNAGKSKLELDFEARGGKKGIGLNWNLSNKIPDALKQ